MPDFDMSEFDIFDTKIGKDFRRGLLKVFILKMLATEDVHGYAMMNKIEEVTGGKWKPSSGSMYPALFHLKAAGLIKVKIVDKRKMYTITAKGREATKNMSENFDIIANEISLIFKKL